jgi:hypothetical protein
MAEIARWAQMWAVTSIDPDLMRSIFIRPFRSIQEAVDAAVAEKGREKILFMMAASMTIPRLRKRLVLRSSRFIFGSRISEDKIPIFYEDSVELPKNDSIIASLMENR